MKSLQERKDVLMGTLCGLICLAKIGKRFREAVNVCTKREREREGIC